MEKVVSKISDQPVNQSGDTTGAKAKRKVFRKERKYAIYEVDVFVVENLIRAHPAMFFKPFPPRYVNNIYFDSPSFRNYGDNVVGSKSRKKFRIRWYGNQFGYIEKPVLEVKIKEGLAGTKMHYPLSSFTLKEGFGETAIWEVLNESEIPDEIREYLKHLTPTLLNRYYRKYFISADRKFRLTLDHKLVFTNLSKRNNYFLKRVADRSKVIIEIKYDIEHDEHVDRISSYFPFRMTKNSKYVNGIDHLDVR